MYDTGGYSFVVALDVETGALKLLLDDAGVPLHDATPGTQYFLFACCTSTQVRSTQRVGALKLLVDDAGVSLSSVVPVKQVN